MFYTWGEVAKWIHITFFEIFILIFSIFAFTILLTIKLSCDDFSFVETSRNLSLVSFVEQPQPASNLPSLSWANVFLPLFLFDLVSLYLCIIICIRQIHESSFTTFYAILRFCFNLQRIFLTFIVKYLLCNILSNTNGSSNSNITYSEILLPILYMILVLFCRSFKI